MNDRTLNVIARAVAIQVTANTSSRDDAITVLGYALLAIYLEDQADQTIEDFAKSFHDALIHTYRNRRDLQ